MPELPEVETVVRELNALILDKEILSITPIWNKSYNNQCIVSESGQIVQKIGRKGKYIIIELSESFLIVHLRMTGQLLPGSNSRLKSDPHVRVIIRFADNTNLYFKDTRKFGRIYHVNHPDIILSKVGIDALDPGLSAQWFTASIRNSKMNIKALLLSQKLLSGIGNIYADESLFRTGVHPGSVASEIPEKKSDELFRNIQAVLRSAIENMGSTISDYRDAYGNAGKNQHFLKVYQQTGNPCQACGEPILKIRIAGRGTHICSRCQKRYQ